MTYSGQVTEHVEEVRWRSIDVLDGLVRKAEEFGLGEPPPILERCRRKLRENTCKVLVVGGAKRGKSTFVNALIGRDVLPTGAATGQVFNIRPSREEAYRLRFEDGSEQGILPENLGSADAGVVAGIRWVEVDAPVRFLPEGLSLLDVPGPVRNAERFVPEADAMFFLLESGESVTGDDLEFIEEILDVTHDIFFIQTKTDRYAEEDWRGIQRLNQEILEERFEGRLADTRVWPISSMNLRKATTEDASPMADYYRELAVALRTFMAGVAGWNRVAEAMLVAVRYHAAIREVFSGQLVAFDAESEQKRSEMQRITAEGKRRFEEDWSPRGRKYLELRENLQRVIAVGKQSFANTLQVGGDIELTQKAKIDEIQSLTQANRVGKEMSDEVVAAAMNDWARVRQEVQHRCVDLLGPDGSSAPPDVFGSAVSNVSLLDVKFKTDYFTMLRGAASGIILLAAASVAVAATGVSLPPLGLVAVPILLVLVVSGIRHARKNQLKAARQELRMHLAEVLQKVRRHFFDVDLPSGRFSLMDEYFGALERSVHEQARTLVEKKSRDADAELARLAEAMQLDDRERNLRARETHERSVQWDSIGKSARDIMALVTEQTGDTSVNGYYRALLRRLDETPPIINLPKLDKQDEVPGTAHQANTRQPIKPESVPSSFSPADPVPLSREAVPTKGRSEKAKRFDGFAGRSDLSGEQAADRRYAELKRRHAIGARLRWAVAPAILAALAWGGWFAFMG